MTLRPDIFSQRPFSDFLFRALESAWNEVSKKYRVGGVSSSGLHSRSQNRSPTPSKKLTPENVHFFVKILTLGFGLICKNTFFGRACNKVAPVTKKNIVGLEECCGWFGCVWSNSYAGPHVDYEYFKALVTLRMEGQPARWKRHRLERRNYVCIEYPPARRGGLFTMFTAPQRTGKGRFLALMVFLALRCV